MDSSILRLYVQQQWDLGMLSLICDDVEDDTAVAVQRDFNSLERHITAIQLRNTHHSFHGSRLRIIWGLGGSIGGLTGIGGLEDYGDSGVF